MPTIRALKANGVLGLMIDCQGCGASREVAWRQLNVTDEVELSARVARLRCKRCGRKPTISEVDPIVLDDTPLPI